MSNPLSLLPIAIAAGGGRVDGTPGAQLVAAGFSLLQRSAPLVRALAGKRSAILLPASRAFVTALAASDGRGAVFVDSGATTTEVLERLDDAEVGAIFTNRALASLVPAGTRPVVLLDGAPRSASIRAGGTDTAIDLGSHFGLDLEGKPEPGRDEECAIVFGAATAGIGSGTGSGTARGAVLTHRNLLAGARGTIDALSLHGGDHVLAAMPVSQLFGFTVAIAAPLIAGARVTTMDPFSAEQTLAMLERGDVTVLVGVPAMYTALVALLEHRRVPLAAPAPRVCCCLGASLAVELQDRWFECTGVELRQGYGLVEAGSICLFNVPHYPNRRGTLGIPFPGVRVSVRDHASSAACTAGTAGEICVHGDTVFRGYLHGGQAGLAVHDGWLHTGDQGRERADGTFEYLGPIERLPFTASSKHREPA